MANFIDLTGQRFGRLQAIEKADMRIAKSVVWKCQCDCGNVTYKTQQSLSSGHSNSCGCLLSEHGKQSIPMAQSKRVKTRGTIIDNINHRATNKNNQLGIKGVCYNKTRGKYQAEIMLNRKHIFLGRFDAIEDAVKAREQAEEELFHPIIEEYENIRKQEVAEDG